MIVVRPGPPDFPPSNAQELMKDVVIGTIVPFTELENITDWATIKRVCLNSLDCEVYTDSPYSTINSKLNLP